jgi:hypothetical protein
LPTITTLVQYSVWTLELSYKGRERNKRDQNRKGKVKWSLFVCDVILYLKGPKQSTERILVFYTLSTKSQDRNQYTNSVDFLCTNKKLEEKVVNNTIQFTVLSKCIKYLFKNLTKCVKYNENCKKNLFPLDLLLLLLLWSDFLCLFWLKLVWYKLCLIYKYYYSAYFGGWLAW